MEQPLLRNGVDLHSRTVASLHGVGTRVSARKGERPSDVADDLSGDLRKLMRKTSMHPERRLPSRDVNIIEVNTVADVFPVSLASARAVASFGNCASWAQCTHVVEGHDCTQQLTRECSQTDLSLARGLGPPRQCAPVDVSKVTAHSRRGFRLFVQHTPSSSRHFGYSARSKQRA